MAIDAEPFSYFWDKALLLMFCTAVFLYVRSAAPVLRATCPSARKTQAKAKKESNHARKQAHLKQQENGRRLSRIPETASSSIPRGALI